MHKVSLMGKEKYRAQTGHAPAEHRRERRLGQCCSDSALRPGKELEQCHPAGGRCPRHR